MVFNKSNLAGSFLLHESLKDPCNTVIKIVGYHSNRHWEDIKGVLNRICELFLKWHKCIKYM